MPEKDLVFRTAVEMTAFRAGVHLLAHRKFRAALNQDGGGEKRLRLSPGVSVKGNTINAVGTFFPDDWDWEDSYGPAVITARAIREAFDQVGGEVFLDLDSDGGYLDTGKAVAGAVDDFRSRDGNSVVARVRSIAASAATLPMIRADRILVDELAEVMIHPPMTIAAGKRGGSPCCGGLP